LNKSLLVLYARDFEEHFWGFLGLLDYPGRSREKNVKVITDLTIDTNTLLF